jgi:hypothetical protein
VYPSLCCAPCSFLALALAFCWVFLWGGVVERVPVGRGGPAEAERLLVFSNHLFSVFGMSFQDGLTETDGWTGGPGKADLLAIDGVVHLGYISH